MQLIYSFSVWCYGIIISLASLRSKKAKKWIAGRRDFKKDIFPEGLEGCVWFHCASLGEFEQGRPVIEKLKEQSPETKILLTFFSPSGYEVRKDYSLADHVCYLPLDTIADMEPFVEAIQPRHVVFVKYEFWFNLLSILRDKDIPHTLISGIFRKGQHFFKWYGGWFKEGLKGYSKVFVQNESSKLLLNSIQVDSELAGDTRFDRVVKVVKEAKSVTLVETFVDGQPMLIAGSSWLPDEKLIAIAKKKEAWKGKIIIVPHEVHDGHIQKVMELFPDALRFSKLDMAKANQSDVLIIDQIGLLNRVYRYAEVAWIGGGFGKGVHNTLEAAAYGLPVIFGPNNKKFQEIQELKSVGAGWEVKDQKTSVKALEELQKEDVLRASQQKAKAYVESKIGATDLAVKWILKTMRPENRL
ncbi:MAG: 3-deoxy-D-manno-octulosonic acid transferase [Flavobacteriales bacterium]|nr:3-deoxy-D-manno-octulosonic acid transferase [Flavobacteriales bacterium]